MNWLAQFRRWRRRISVAVLPAFAWYSLSAAACFGMPAEASATHHHMASMEHAAAANSAGDAAQAMHDHADMPPCSHCPTPVNDDQPAPAICLTQGTSNANGPTASATPDIFKLFYVTRLTVLPSTAAPLPLIRTVASRDVPQFEQTPLNIRNCVFLI